MTNTTKLDFCEAICFVVPANEVLNINRSSCFRYRKFIFIQQKIIWKTRFTALILRVLSGYYFVPDFNTSNLKQSHHNDFLAYSVLVLSVQYQIDLRLSFINLVFHLKNVSMMVAWLTEMKQIFLFHNNLEKMKLYEIWLLKLCDDIIQRDNSM